MCKGQPRCFSLLAVCSKCQKVISFISQPKELPCSTSCFNNLSLRLTTAFGNSPFGGFQPTKRIVFTVIVLGSHHKDRQKGLPIHGKRKSARLSSCLNGGIIKFGASFIGQHYSNRPWQHLLPPPAFDSWGVASLGRCAGKYRIWSGWERGERQFYFGPAQSEPLKSSETPPFDCR